MNHRPGLDVLCPVCAPLLRATKSRAKKTAIALEHARLAEPLTEELAEARKDEATAKLLANFYRNTRS
jgi:hypothetical protein